MTQTPAFQMRPIEEVADLFGRGPLPAAPYFDTAWWELERQAIFMRTWLHIGHVCEVPAQGAFIRRDLEFANASLLVIRGQDDRIRAFHNVCVHRGTQLVQEAQGKRALFACPYHRWTYGTDGQLVSAPDFERFYVAKEDCHLRQVALEICGGMIFVNLAAKPSQSLHEFFGPIAGELDTLPVARATDFSEWVYEIEANWKLNFDNFQENYHLRFIHPRTGEQAVGDANPFGYPSAYGFCGPHRSQVLWRNPSPPPLPPVLRFAFERAAALAGKDGGVWAKTDYKLFPCLHVVGLANNFYTHTMTPLGPARTRGQIRMYWTGESECASRMFTREFTSMSIRDVLSEDRLAVEAGQRGISSGAIKEIHFQDHEILLRHLYKTVESKIAEYRLEQGMEHHTLL